MEKSPTANAWDVGSVPGLGRSPGEGNGVATHSSILVEEIPRTEEPWQAVVHGVAKNQAQLSY